MYLNFVLVLLVVFTFSVPVIEAGPFLGGLGSHLGLVNCPAISYDDYTGTIPASFDSRSEWPPCISPIRNQEDCGCCWAFAATSVLADRFCIESNNTIRRLLSPQYMVGCDTNCQYPVMDMNCQEGCEGGYMDNAWTYFISSGVVKDQCVQYLGEDESCMSTCNSGASISNQTEFRASVCYQLSSVRDAQIDIMLHGPIQTGFTVYTDFESYTGGVYEHNSGDEVGGHSVRIIGWGVLNGVDYWLVANSWGTDWGEDGYFMIERGVDECGIEDNMIAGLPYLASVQQPEYGPWGPSLASSTSILGYVWFLVVAISFCFVNM